MVVEIAIGTMVGVLAAVIIGMVAYRWYQMANVPETWPAAKRYLILFVTVAFCGFVWVKWTDIEKFLDKQYVELQRQRAAAEKLNEDKEHCKLRGKYIVETASYAHSRQEVDYQYGSEVRLPFGWLIFCAQHGFVSREDFDRAVEIQKKTQIKYEATKLARLRKEAEEREKARKKEIDDLMQGLRGPPVKWPQ